jgi:hypothetical protein
MSKKRYKMEVSTSVQIIREARKHMKKMPMERKIDLMVEAGLFTVEQGERAKKKLAEMAAAENGKS